MSDKLIDQIVIDHTRHLFNSLESVKEKLDYYRQLSNKGLSNLSDKEFSNLQLDVQKFFNIQFAAFADTYPTRLFRISFNKPITNEGRGGQLKKISQLLGPPEAKSKLNRCNHPNESIFYAALDINTAIWETQPQPGDVITLSEWKIKEGQKLICHTIFNHPEIHSVNLDAKKAYEEYIMEMSKAHPKHYEFFDTIIRFITEEFIKPVAKDKPKEYLFSAFFASGLYKPTPNGFRIESIAYPSIQRKYGVTNLAILNSLVLDKLELLAITTHDVLKVNYEIDSKSNVPPLGVFPAFQRITEFDLANDKIIYPEILQYIPGGNNKHT